MPADACPESTLRHFLESHGVQPEHRVNLAVSGGLDSMALLHAAHRVHPLLTVLHVDHGLREASKDDRAFVEATCAQLGIPFIGHRVTDLQEQAAEHGEGLEAAARAARYGWFSEQVGSGGILLTAHHGDDQRETRLLHWLRGSRPESWTGMAPWTTARGHRLGRPFLDLSRAGLEAWMRGHGHGWREDASNADPAHLRNRVRHELLPLLDDLRTGWESGMERHGRLAQEWADATDALLSDLPDAGTLLPLDHIASAPSPRMLLVRWAGRWGWPASRVDALLHLIQSDTEVGKEARGATHRFIRERQGLAVFPLAESEAHPEWTWSPEAGEGNIATPWGTLTWQCVGGGTPPDPRDETAQLDLSQLTWPLTLRTWTAGDQLQPLGMTGHQNVSDILNQRGVDHAQRETALLLVQADGQPVWLLGHRIDRRSALPENGKARQILSLTWTPA